MGSLLSYVVVELKESTLNDQLIPGSPSTYTPITAVNDIRQTKYCTMCTIPLRVCNAITLYKSQGLTI